jgi:hypothetical protein
MLIELCAGNYAVSDGLINGADGLFKASTTYLDKSIMWILFSNIKVGTFIREKSSHLYTNEIENDWTPIEPLVKEIRVGKVQSHLITRIQFLVQLATARIIHRSQGLSLDELAFDSTNVKKHGLTYIVLSRIRTKEKLYLLAPLEDQFFCIDKCVQQEMVRLTTTALWKPCIPNFKKFQTSHIIIQALNTNSLRQHFEDILNDHALQSSYILCLIETRIQSTSSEICNFIDTSKYSYISVFDGHGILMLYDGRMILHSSETFTIDGSEYIAATFNIKIRKEIYIICVYKAHTCSISAFLRNLQTLIQKSPTHCPTIILGDFNIDILKDNNDTSKKGQLIQFMSQFSLQSQFSASTTKGGTQLDHIWANIHGNDSKAGVSEAYWLDYHKPIYIVFKLSNTLPSFHNKSLSSLYT